MGELSQPSSGDAPYLAVSAPADVVAGTEVSDSIVIPVADFAVGDLLEFQFSGVIASYDFDNDDWSWSLFFSDNATVLPPPTGTGTEADVTYSLRGALVRVTGVGSNVRMKGLIEISFFDEIHAISFDDEVSDTQADLISLGAQVVNAIDVSQQAGFMRITHNTA